MSEDIIHCFTLLLLWLLFYYVRHACFHWFLILSFCFNISNEFICLLINLFWGILLVSKKSLIKLVLCFVFIINFHCRNNIRIIIRLCVCVFVFVLFCYVYNLSIHLHWMIHVYLSYWLTLCWMIQFKLLNFFVYLFSFPSLFSIK